MWCRNNLSAVGKWGGVSFLFGAAITAFVVGGNTFLRAYMLDTVSTSSYQPNTEFKLDLTDPLNSINSINNVTLPVNNLINNAINGLRFNQNIDIGTWIPLSPIKNPSQDMGLSRFFGSSRVSANDITSFLKEAAVTGINLSILIISITTQVLKGLLSVLK